MNKVIFDSSALIAIINQEKDFEEIEKMLPYSSMSLINVSEVITVLTRNGIPQEEVNLLIEELIPEILPFDYDIALLTGTLISETQPYGLSLGDRSCIATGIKHARTIYTTDKAWENINNIQNVQIKLIKR